MDKIRKIFCWSWGIYCIYRNESILARNIYVFMHIFSSIILFLLTILVVRLKFVYMIMPVVVIIAGVFTFFYPIIADPLLSDEERLEILTKIEGEL